LLENLNGGEVTTDVSKSSLYLEGKWFKLNQGLCQWDGQLELDLKPGPGPLGPWAKPDSESPEDAGDLSLNLMQIRRWSSPGQAALHASPGLRMHLEGCAI
jgi:hypothetical protein